jgi:TRAP-type C4-dicarboxylate transport system permease small subunit
MDHSAGRGPAQPPPDEVMSDLPGEGTPAASGRLAGAAYVLGGMGLLGATAADSIAVAGRHTGFHLLGAIELVQTAVVLLGASAMLIATIVGGHASVHMVTERLAKPTAAHLARIAAFVSGLVFLILAAGSAWVAADLWHGFEQTELLRIPLRWLRLVWIVFALLIAASFFRHALRTAR